MTKNKKRQQKVKTRCDQSAQMGEAQVAVLRTFLGAHSQIAGCFLDTRRLLRCGSSSSSQARLGGAVDRGRVVPFLWALSRACLSSWSNLAHTSGGICGNRFRNLWQGWRPKQIRESVKCAISFSLVEKVKPQTQQRLSPPHQLLTFGQA